MNDNQPGKTDRETKATRIRIRGLKIVMIGGGAIETLMGLAFVFAPVQVVTMTGHGTGPTIGAYFISLLGTCILIPSVFIMIASRDPLRNISWVQFATVWAVVAVIVQTYSIMKGFATFHEVGGPLLLDVLFAIVYLSLYPWGVKHTIGSD